MPRDRAVTHVVLAGSSFQKRHRLQHLAARGNPEHRVVECAGGPDRVPGDGHVVELSRDPRGAQRASGESDGRVPRGSCGGRKACGARSSRCPGCGRRPPGSQRWAVCPCHANARSGLTARIVCIAPAPRRRGAGCCGDRGGRRWGCGRRAGSGRRVRRPASSRSGRRASRRWRGCRGAGRRRRGRRRRRPVRRAGGGPVAGEVPRDHVPRRHTGVVLCGEHRGGAPMWLSSCGWDGGGLG